MTIKVVFLIVATAITVAAQSLQPSEYVLYEGYYLLEVQEDDPFENFWQLEFHLLQPDNSPPRLIGKALIYTNHVCDVGLRSFAISKDSLQFVTEECTGERYEFQGKFLGVPSDFEGDHENPVLEGVLTYCKDGKVIKQQTVRFLYSVGC